MASPGAKVIPLTATEEREIAVLTARMQAADEEAFGLFHERYCDRLFRYLLVFCRGDEPLARDLLQATMLKVVRAIRVFDAEEAFWNWLAAIARNAFFDHIRQLRRAPKVLSLWDEGAREAAAPHPSEVDAALVTALE